LVNRSIVISRLAFIEEAVAQLKKLGAESREVFLHDKLRIGAAESYLRRSLEAIFDIGRHILVHTGWQDFSMEYKSIARGLVEKEIVTSTLDKKLIQMAGYRNRLVHFYHQVTAEELYDIMQKDLDDVQRFVDDIKKYLSS